MTTRKNTNLRFDLHPAVEDSVAGAAIQGNRLGISDRKAYRLHLEEIDRMNRNMTRVGNPPRPAWLLVPAAFCQFGIWFDFVAKREAADTAAPVSPAVQKPRTRRGK